MSVGTYGGNITSEPTFTQVVNAHGGLLTLRMEPFAGQKFVLKNLKTGMSRRCGVVQDGKVCQQRIPDCVSVRNPRSRFLAYHVST